MPDCASFSLGCRLPSTASAEGFPSLFGCFTGTTRQSDSSIACMSALWLCAFADRSARLADALEVSRFSCMLFLDVPGSSTTPRPALARDSVASTDIAFPLSKQGRHAVRQLSGLNSPAHRCLCLRFAVRLATHHARLEVGIESLLLSRRALSSPTTCRFIPAHLRPWVALSSCQAIRLYGKCPSAGKSEVSILAGRR